jgi:hypothetical protein
MAAWTFSLENALSAIDIELRLLACFVYLDLLLSFTASALGFQRSAGLLQQLAHQGRPARLMAGPEALSGVAVEIFVEKNEIAPVGIAVKLWHGSVYAAVNWAVALFVPQENSDEATRDFGGHFGKREPVAGARRKLDFEIVAEIVMKLLQRFDEQVVHGKPHGAAPIRIAAE